MNELTADELRRLREAATPGPVEIDIRYHEAAIIACADRSKKRGWAADPKMYAEEFAHPIVEGRYCNKADWEFIAYLWNHAAAIEEALRDGERLGWLADNWTPGYERSEIDLAFSLGYMEHVRAAIDAARKEGA